jgi:glycosyltransferase involved in cell wall biosynthesis
MPDQRRLLLVSTSMARGGAEQQVVDLASALRVRQWTVAVLSMTTPSDHQEALAAADVELVSLDMTPGRPTPAAFARYLLFVRRWRPRVIHAHMVHANLLARLGHVASWHVPVVCTVHNEVEGPRWREIAYRLTDPLASCTSAVSQAAVDRYVRVGAVPNGRIVMIPNGVDVTRRPATEGARDRIRGELALGDDFLWVNVARLMPEKDHASLLRAFAIVRLTHPGARLVIAGDGPLRSSLAALIEEAGLGDSVSLLGIRKDVSSILAAADAFVLSSLWEGLPMVLLEAAGQGLPIVSTDVGGCREIARPDLGAVLSRTGPDGIAEAMLEVMKLGATARKEMGQRLQHHVRANYDLETVVTTWERVYASVIGR